MGVRVRVTCDGDCDPVRVAEDGEECATCVCHEVAPLAQVETPRDDGCTRLEHCDDTPDATLDVGLNVHLGDEIVGEGAERVAWGEGEG